jgi:hypothetical protein
MTMQNTLSGSTRDTTSMAEGFWLSGHCLVLTGTGNEENTEEVTENHQEITGSQEETELMRRNAISVEKQAIFRRIVGTEIEEEGTTKILSQEGDTMKKRTTIEEKTIDKTTEEEITEKIMRWTTGEDQNPWKKRFLTESHKQITMLTEKTIQGFNSKTNANYKVFYVKLLDWICSVKRTKEQFLSSQIRFLLNQESDSNSSDKEWHFPAYFAGGF